MSATSQWLESRGWRLFSRRKHGMYIKERWYHPRDGSITLNQGEAVRAERSHAKFNRDQRRGLRLVKEA